MSLITIFLIAVGLSMDSLAVCISGGICMDSFSMRKALKMATIMGLFQGGMTGLGWALGIHFSSYITGFDHWIAFILLGYLGGKMIYGSFRQEEQKTVLFSTRMLLISGVATSIDALAVGVSMAFLQLNICLPVIIIALTTFILSLCGVAGGFRFGQLKGLRVEIVGGIILIAIGIKILLEHTLLE